MSRTLADLAGEIGGEVHGDADCVIAGVATLSDAQEGDLAFIAGRRYADDLTGTRASAVILTQEYLSSCPVNAIVVADAYLGYARAAALLHPPVVPRRGVHPTAVVSSAAELGDNVAVGAHTVIEPGAVIGANVCVGPGCYIGENARLGADSRLVANVTICHGTIVGQRALIHPGAVLGSDGFGFANDAGTWVKVPQLGVVRVGDDVEIGANTTIDRGAMTDTVLEDGVKVDNLVQIAHNVQIGAHTAIAGCTGIAGSAKIGKHCALGGGVGISGHLELADNVVVSGMSLVTKSIKSPGVYASGLPMQEVSAWRKSIVRIRQLDELARRLKSLEQRLSDSEG